MPKYTIHVLVMEKVAEELSGTEYGRILSENRNIAAVGAIGPDLFFWAPDYVVCQVLLEFYELWDEVKEVYNKTIGKVVEAVEVVKEGVEDVMEVVSPGIVAILNQIFDEMEELFTEFLTLVTKGPLAAFLRIENMLTDAAKLPDATAVIFDQFKPPLQLGKGEEEWYWFDMLHYRETGKFAKKLIELAETEEQKAYAYAYLTHIATDVVGHGYVNQIVGAPYRNAVQRHVVVENFMDAWAFHEYVGGDIATDLVDWLSLPDELPESIVDMLYRAFREVYDGKSHPRLINSDGFLTKEDIKTTYNLFLRVTRLLEDKIREPEEPITGLMDILQEMGERFWENLANPPEPPEVEGDCSIWDYLSFGLTEKSRECYDSLVDNIQEWLKWFGEAIMWSLENFRRLMILIETALASIGAIYILGFLYFMQLSLYGVLLKIRELFALNALVYPPVSLVYTSHGRNLITPYQCQTSRKQYPAAWRLEKCLKCLGSPYEMPYTLPASYAESDTPKTFIEEDKLNLKYLRLYAYSETPEQTRSLYRFPAKGDDGYVPRIGSAVKLAAWMIRNQNDPIVEVNWNLDSDRGFGYKQWRGNLPPKNDTVTDEVYL